MSQLPIRNGNASEPPHLPRGVNATALSFFRLSVETVQTMASIFQVAPEASRMIDAPLNVVPITSPVKRWPI